MRIPSSELILNDNGSVYHLHLRPEDIAHTIITVGDPDRVDTVTAYFDTIRFTTQKREFKTTTGRYQGKDITVISTGIGTDNVDIVLNELDALVNINLETRAIKKDHTQLDIVRIGTSGAVQADIPIDSFLLSTYAMGLDALLHFYDCKEIQYTAIQDAFVSHMEWSTEKSTPYVIACDGTLAQKFSSTKVLEGFTATNIGFYAPQGRVLRLATSDTFMNQKLASFRFRESEITPTSTKNSSLQSIDNLKQLRITNLEMETSGIYGLAKLLGHRAVSLNAILANRATQEFSTRPEQTTKRLIKYALDCLVAK